MSLLIGCTPAVASTVTAGPVAAAAASGSRARQAAAASGLERGRMVMGHSSMGAAHSETVARVAAASRVPGRARSATDRDCPKVEYGVRSEDLTPPSRPALPLARRPEIQGREASGSAGAEPAGPLGGQGAPATVGAHIPRVRSSDLTPHSAWGNLRP